jgi:hypothetical protein
LAVARLLQRFGALPPVDGEADGATPKFRVVEEEK